MKTCFVRAEAGKIALDKGKTASIRLEETAWVCNRPTTLEFVVIVRSGIVAAGSVVTHNVLESSVL